MKSKRNGRDAAGRWMAWLLIFCLFFGGLAQQPSVAFAESGEAAKAETQEEIVGRAGETSQEGEIEETQPPVKDEASEGAAESSSEPPATQPETETTTAPTQPPVTENETQPAAELSEKEVTLEVGTSKVLEIKNLPSGVAIEWKTEDSSIVSVTPQSGNAKAEMKANMPGQVKISAVFGSGEILECAVTVPEVKLSADSLTLLKGKTKKLTVSGSSGTVTWTSSKKKVLTVDANGKLTAVAYGSANVTAKIGSVALTCKIQVVDPALNKTSLYLLKGTTYTLKGKQYTGTVKWSSTDKKVATVSAKGVVTAKKDGTAKIRMKANGVYVDCQVTVATAKLSVSQLNMENGKSYTIKVSGTAKKGTWSSSDKATLTVSSKGKCKAKKTGEATVTYKVGDSSLTCYIIIAKKGANKTFGGSVSQTNVGITSLRNQVFGKSSRYRFLQGSCTDGTYGYFLLGDKNYQPYCAIAKIRLSDWKVVKKKTGLMLYHGNDMAYKDGSLVVVHGGGYESGVTYVDAKTLAITGRNANGESYYSIAYNKKRNQYVVGVSSSKELKITDDSFATQKTFTHLKLDKYTRQGIDCDDSYIYVLQSYLSGKKTRILVYDWNGNYVTQVTIAGYLEGESLFHVGQQFVVSYNNSSYSGGTIFTTSMKRYYQVRYAAGGGTGRMSPKMLKTGKGGKLAANKFTRKGYKFKGWNATRSSDGKKLYRNKSTRKTAWYKPGSQPKSYELYNIPNKKKLGSMSSVPGDCITMTAVWKKK